ncbi:hypothetical protein KHS38_10030 [Mucilaginibacter sp. Bleaf8]|uniref:hypothetical protein n=1 Tax=Mucilaginibacter sp. Bleaf8 TaxID=2834430 RepID=UPI001BCCF06A|nr:hypothetical protein [Mucilaginibacter sp. Bleaf8]MBS7564742.1 hypothetical protein [Mucilaginibacter sp. Bleaf8]
MRPQFNYFDPEIRSMVEAHKFAGNYAEAVLKKVVHLSSIDANLESGTDVLAFH